MIEHINIIEALNDQICALLDLMRMAESSVDIQSINTASEMCLTMQVDYDRGYQQGRADKYEGITSEYMLLTEKQVSEIRADTIDEFADYLRMSYDKGMRLSVAMCKRDIEKFKLKALYSKFIDAIDDCVKAFNDLEQLKGQIDD